MRFSSAGYHAPISGSSTNTGPPMTAPNAVVMPNTTATSTSGRPGSGPLRREKSATPTLVSFHIASSAPPRPAIAAASANACSFVAVRSRPSVTHAEGESRIAWSRRPNEPFRITVSSSTMSAKATAIVMKKAVSPSRPGIRFTDALPTENGRNCLKTAFAVDVRLEEQREGHRRSAR